MSSMLDKDKLDISLEYIQKEYSLNSLLTQWGITLKSKTIKCPLHADSRPSCVIDLENNRYKCFSCGSGGGYINLLREYKTLVKGERTSTSKLVEEILKNDEKMQSVLNFNTIFINKRETYDANLYIDMQRTPYKPKYVNNMNYTNILKHVEKDVDKLLDFFALVEKDYPNQLLYEKFVNNKQINGVVTGTEAKEYGEEIKALLFGDDFVTSNSDDTNMFED